MSSENQGIHINLTAETSVFTTKIRAAQQTLTGLKNEVSTLKTQEASLENSISRLTSQLDKKQRSLDVNRTRLKTYEEANKGSSDAAERLRGIITRQEEAVKTLTDKLNSNSRDLKENASAQYICANKIRLATAEVDKLTTEYSQNTQELRENEAANKDFANTLKTGLMTLKGIALGYAGKTLYSALIGTNAEYEQYLTSFDVLLQSSEKAEKMINNLDKFGADTPFELPDLTSATEQLLAFGTAEEDVMTRLQQLGDLSKGKADILERITLAYGKMQAKGKVTLEELNMLTEAGVPILRELANQLGVTTDVLFKKISDGEINIEHINTAIAAMTSEGGQFFGMMAQQAQTMDGMMSTLGDNTNIALRQLGEGAFDAVKDEISDLLAEIQRMNNDGSLKAFAENAGSTVASAVKILLEFVSVLYDMRGAILTVGTAAITFKALKSGADMVSKASATIKAYTAVLKLMHQAHENGITKSTLFSAALGKEEAVIKTLEAAGYKDITVKNGMVTATNAATSATETFKVASMALNAALGLVSAAISIGIMAYSSYKQKQEEARQAAYSAADAAQEEKKSVKELIDEYKQLRTAGDWDNTARERAREIQEELTKLVGGEVEGLDLVNGRLEDQIRLLDEATLKKAKEDRDVYLDAKNKSGDKLEQAIWWDGYESRIGYFSDSEQKLFNDAGFDMNDLSAKIHFKDLDDFMDKYPKILELKDKLINANLEESNSYTFLCQIVEQYGEKYEEYKEKLTNYQENEAVVHLGEYMKKNDINSQEAFDKYIESINKSKEDSAQYKEVLKQIANEAFPQYSRAVKNTAGALDELGGSTQSAADTVDALEEVGGSLSTLGDAQEELSKSGKLSLSTIADIKENFSGLGAELDGYIERLIESNGNTEATRQVMGDMTNALIQNKFSTEELANADTGLIATMLEEAGVANSVEYATYLVNDAKAKTKVSSFDFANATEKEIGTLYEDIKALGWTADEAKSLVAEKLALELQNAATYSTVNEFIAGLDDEAAALGITKDELINLIYASIDFNDTDLDVSQKTNALYSLALQAYNTAEALSMVQNTGNIAGQIYNEWLTEHPGDYEGAERAQNEHLSWAYKQLKSKLKIEDVNTTKRKPYTPKYTGKGSPGSDKKEPTKNDQLEAYKKNIAEEDRLAERSYKRKREYEQISDEEYYNSLETRAANYRKYATEVLSLTYATEEEKAELNKEYIEKAEDLELEAYSGYIKWIDEMLEAGNYSEVYNGLDQIATYTDSFYKTEKGKLDDALTANIISQEEYIEKSNKLMKEYGEQSDSVSKLVRNAVDSEFLSYIDTAKKYIADRNFYGDWSEWGDNEEQALARMFGNVDKWREKGVSNDVWINAYDELSKNIFEVSKENLLSAIEEEEEILREKYEKELDMKKEAAEKELDIAKEKANAEIDAINAKADAEIKRIDELIQKRKEAREDEDYNLRLQRLQLKLEYEHDEDNKIALRKEINKLREEIADMEFDREMTRQKELIEENRDKDIESVNARLEKETATANRKISSAEARYTEQTSDTAIANELANKFNYRGYEGIFESLGIDFADGISRGLQGILSAFNESFGGLSASKANYDYSSNSKIYNMYASFSGAQSETDITRGLRKFLEKIELEGRI